MRTSGQRFTNSPLAASGNINNNATSVRPLDFNGTVNNGTFTLPLTSDGTNGTMVSFTSAGGDQNLVGNPYPSAIDANLFLVANSDINGSIYLWTSPKIGHDGKYPHSTGFAAYNGTMGVASGTDASFKPSSFIAPGQGFSVYATCGDCTGKVITFNNAMRVTTETGGRKFARISNENDPKIWLSLKDKKSELISRIGIGYVEKSTKSFDRFYDAPVIASELYKFYSKVDNQKLIINGNGTFDKNDVVSLGFDAEDTTDRIYEIALDKTAGSIFESGQEVILKDKILGVNHNLSKNGKYTFTSNEKSNESRFELKYTEDKNKEIELIKNEFGDLKVALKNESLIIQSNKEVSFVKVYDLNGKLVYSLNGNNRKELIETVKLQKSIYIINLDFKDGTNSSLKILE